MSFKEEYKNYLEHHGVRGMRWGVRKSSAISNKSTKKRDKIVNQFIKSLGIKVKKKYTGYSIPYEIMDENGNLILYNFPVSKRNYMQVMKRIEKYKNTKI